MYLFSYLLTTSTSSSKNNQDKPIFSKHEEIFQVQYNEQPPYEANTRSKKPELHFEKQHNCKNTTSQSTFEIIETHMSTSILS